VSVWRWHRPSGPSSLDEIAELVTGCCVRLVATEAVRTTLLRLRTLCG
jgi:hypothetical protein